MAGSVGPVDVAGAARDEHPLREALDAVSDLDDAPGELVSGNERARMAGDGVRARDGVDGGTVLPLAGVRPAHADRVDLDQQLPGAGHGLGRLLHPEIAPAVVDGCSHVFPFQSRSASGFSSASASSPRKRAPTAPSTTR